MLALTLALLALAAAEPQPSMSGGDGPPAPAPLKAEQLQWKSTPRGADFARLFPMRPMRADIEGAATVLCQIGSNHRLTHCVSQSETPEGYGFGDAATKFGGLFELAADQTDPRAREGAYVLVKLRFNLPGHPHS